MEISATVVQGLQVAGSMPDAAFRILAKRAASLSLGDTETDLGKEGVPGVEPAAAKEAFAALSSLLLEAARTDTDTPSLSAVLEECKFAPDRAQALASLYTQHKAKARAALARVASPLPHIVNVDWRLDYHLKSNHLERVNKPVYLVELKTQHQGQPSLQSLQFACSQEQLQDLVYKLKDAAKSLDKFSQQR